MKPQTTKQAPAWHKEAITLLETRFAEIEVVFLDAVRKAHWLGAFLRSIRERGEQDGSIRHSRFIPWLRANCPKVMSSRTTVFEYLFMAKSAEEITGDKPSEFRTVCLPESWEKLIDGKTQRKLFLEYKQSKVDAEGNLIPQPGRRPGEGGKEAEPATIAENLEYHRKYSLRHMGVITHEMDKMHTRLLACDDDVLNAYHSAIQRTDKLLNFWLNTPRDKRDPKAAEKLWSKS